MAALWKSLASLFSQHGLSSDAILLEKRVVLSVFHKEPQVDRHPFCETFLNENFFASKISCLNGNRTPPIIPFTYRGPQQNYCIIWREARRDDLENVESYCFLVVPITARLRPKYVSLFHKRRDAFFKIFFFASFEFALSEDGVSLFFIFLLENQVADFLLLSIFLLI